MKKKNCVGCRNDFYNGNNSIGVTECWSLKDAKMKTRYAIGINTPAYRENFIKVRKPSCYHTSGTAYVDSITGYARRPKP